MGIRRKAREIALQVLYQQELCHIEASEEALIRFCNNFEIHKKSIPYAKILIDGVSGQLEQVDALIKEHAVNWRLDRMSLVDKSIIRLAIYEMCFQEDVPTSVAINEAIEVARKYSTDDAGSFINGILDAVRKAKFCDKEE
ncbi:transcription antitermination factor NusB [Thermodesulfobacteriota bacterium]